MHIQHPADARVQQLESSRSRSWRCCRGPIRQPQQPPLLLRRLWLQQGVLAQPCRARLPQGSQLQTVSWISSEARTLLPKARFTRWEPDSRKTCDLRRSWDSGTFGFAFCLGSKKSFAGLLNSCSSPHLASGSGSPGKIFHLMQGHPTWAVPWGSLFYK